MSACNVGDRGLIPGLGRPPGEGNGNPLQYSCLKNPTDGGAWWATVHGVKKSRTRLSDFTLLLVLQASVLESLSITLLNWDYSLVAQRLKCLPAMWETWVRSLGPEDLLEKEMAIPYSLLPWDIPSTEEPGGLQSMGLQRVRHDLPTKQQHLL